MNSLQFHVEQDGEWFVATCHDPEMAMQAESLDALPAMIRDLVRCRFEESDPKLHWPIRMHFGEVPGVGRGMKLPRDLSGDEVCRALKRPVTETQCDPVIATEW